MEKLLGRFRPKGPPPELRARVLAAAHAAQAKPRPVFTFTRLYAAALAAVLLGALILGAWSEKAHEEHMRALIGQPSEIASVQEQVDKVLAALDGDSRLAAALRPSVTAAVLASRPSPTAPQWPVILEDPGFQGLEDAISPPRHQGTRGPEGQKMREPEGELLRGQTRGCRDSYPNPIILS